MLAELAQLLGSDDAVNTIRNAREVSEVTQLIKVFQFS